MAMDAARLPWASEKDLPPGVRVLELDDIAVVSEQLKRVADADQFSADTKDALSRIVEACSRGFVYVRLNQTSCPEALVPQQMDSFIRFMRESIAGLTDQERASITAKPDSPLRGLVLTGQESTAKVLGTDDNDDLCYKFTWGCDDSDVFPQNAEAWMQRCHKYFKAVRSVAILLLHVLGHALELPPSVVDELCQGQGIVRFLDYPDVPEDKCGDDPRQLRMAAHPDMTSITVLYQQPSMNGNASLQAFLDEKWQDIPPLENTVVINFGEVLTAVSNERIPATYHRVCCPPTGQSKGSARVSIPFFFEPLDNFELELKPGSKFAQHAEAGETKVPFRTYINRLIGSIQKAVKEGQAPA